MQKNPYAARAKISQARLRRLVRCFALDLNAIQIAQIIGLNRNTVNRYVHAIRERIAVACAAEATALSDEPVLGSFAFARRFRDANRGLQTVAFVVELRAGHICTGSATQELKARLTSSAHGRVPCNRRLHVCGSPVATPPCECAAARQERSQLESFWALFKHKQNRLRGTCSRTFHLHLRECEFRFNHRHYDIHGAILQLLKKQPLFLTEAEPGPPRGGARSPESRRRL